MQKCKNARMQKCKKSKRQKNRHKPNSQSSHIDAKKKESAKNLIYDRRYNAS